MSAEPDEVEPLVAYRLEGDKMDFAVWPLPDGAPALALFMTAEVAQAFLGGPTTSGGWRIVRPTKADLMKILEECWEAGTLKAVLDTGQQDKQVLFDIFDVLQANRGK